MTTLEFARDGRPVYKLPGLDAWYPPLSKGSTVTTPAQASTSANAKTSAANRATETALSAYTRDNRIRASDAHGKAADAHRAAADAHDGVGHNLKAASHREAAARHDALSRALSQAGSPDAIARSNHAVSVVKVDSGFEHNDLAKRLVDGVGNPVDHALSARKVTHLEDPGRLGNPAARAAQDAFLDEGEVAAMSETDWTPGALTAASDDELTAILRRGRATLSNPPKIEEHYRNAMVDEAIQQSQRRWAIAHGKAPIDALSVPGRTAVQMQTALDPAKTPTMRPAASNAATMKPIQAMSDAELEAVVDMDRKQRASPDNPFAAPVSETPEKAARSEMFKRAGRGAPIPLFGGDGLTGWR